MRPVSRRALVASLPGIALFGRRSMAQRTQLKIGTATEGGGYTAFADEFIDAVKPIDASLEFTAVSTTGSIENLKQLEKSTMDLGLVQGQVAYEALHGIDRPITAAKVVTVAFVTAGKFAVRAESRFHSITDLKGARVVWGMRNSGNDLLGWRMMEAIGLDPEKDFQAIFVTRAIDGPAMIIDGRASALWGSGIGSPNFIRVANQLRGARFVTPNTNEMERMLARNSFLQRVTVPARTYRGQDAPIDTVGSWTFMMARPDLDDTIGYRLAATLQKIERGSLPTRLLSQAKATETIAALQGLDALQGGVKRFYKKEGLLP